MLGVRAFLCVSSSLALSASCGGVRVVGHVCVRERIYHHCQSRQFERVCSHPKCGRLVVRLCGPLQINIFLFCIDSSYCACKPTGHAECSVLSLRTSMLSCLLFCARHCVIDESYIHGFQIFVYCVISSVGFPFSGCSFRALWLAARRPVLFVLPLSWRGGFLVPGRFIARRPVLSLFVRLFFCFVVISSAFLSLSSAPP